MITSTTASRPYSLLSIKASPRFGQNDLFPCCDVVDGCSKGPGNGFLATILTLGLVIGGGLIGFSHIKDHQQAQQRNTLVQQYTIAKPELLPQIEGQILALPPKQKAQILLDHLPNPEHKALTDKLIQDITDPQLQNQFKTLRYLYESKSDPTMIDAVASAIQKSIAQ